jgi:hypothetical protein
MLRLRRWLGSARGKATVRRRAAEALAACPKQAHRQQADLAMTVAATASMPEPGRFHLTGEFGAVCLVLKPETALGELALRASRAGIQVRQLMPRALLTVAAPPCGAGRS